MTEINLISERSHIYINIKSTLIDNVEKSLISRWIKNNFTYEEFNKYFNDMIASFDYTIERIHRNLEMKYSKKINRINIIDKRKLAIIANKIRNILEDKYATTN